MVLRAHNHEVLFWMRPEERHNHDSLIEQLDSMKSIRTIKLVASSHQLENSHWESVLNAIERQKNSISCLQITFPDLLPLRVIEQLVRSIPKDEKLVLRGIQYRTPLLHHLPKLSKLNVGIQPMWDDATSTRTVQEMEQIRADKIVFTYVKFSAGAFQRTIHHRHKGYHHCKFDKKGTQAFEDHYTENSSDISCAGTELTVMGGLVFEQKTVAQVFANVLGSRSTIRTLHLDLQFGDTKLIEALTSALKHNRSVQKLSVRGANHFDNRAYMMQELQFLTEGFEIFTLLKSLRHHTSLVEFESDIPNATNIVWPFLSRNQQLLSWRKNPGQIKLSLWPSIFSATQPCSTHREIVFQTLTMLNELNESVE